MSGQLPELVGVLGGGRMGAGIAHAFLIGGSRVRVVERDTDAADAARSRIVAAVRASVDRGSTTETADALTGRVDVATEIERFADCELVVEAVPEDRQLKVDALRSVEAVVHDSAVLASNTSSLSIDDLAIGLHRPERFLGLHFFNPVPASALVEVVRGAATDRAVVEPLSTLARTAATILLRAASAASVSRSTTRTREPPIRNA